MGWLVTGLARLALILVWIFTSLVSHAFGGGVWGWLGPLLGVLFLPITALTYAVVYALAGGVSGWAWLWVALAVLADLAAHSPGVRTIQRRSMRSASV
ncbi:MAG TPA: hypothetical protein VF808_11620 [Ktedonobacterales bacterium]